MNARTGKDLEQRIADRAEEYLHAGIMRIAKVGPPARIVGPSRVIWTENPFADFIGTWTECEGRMIALECKSTNEPRLPIAEKSHLQDGQIEWLTHWASSGAAVGLIWEWRESAQMRFMAIGSIVEIASKRRHIKWEEATPVPFSADGQPDFAESFRRVYR